MSDLTAVAVALLLLAGNAFFVGAEFALVSSRRTQIEPRARSGSTAARLTLRGMERVSLMMAGAQLGITMCSLGLGAVGEPAVAHLLGPVLEAAGLPSALQHTVAFVVAMAIVVTLHMVLGEMVPKNIAIAGPDRAALLLGPPLYVIVIALKPVIWLLNALANAVLRLLRVEPQEEVASTFSADEVAAFVEESRREGLLDEYEHELLTGALDFTGAQVGDVLLGTADLVTVPAEVTVAELEDLCAETGHSRFPVAGGTTELVGYLHLKDLLDTPAQRRSQPVRAQWIRPLATVVADQPLRAALRTMQARGAHMARVVDRDTGRVVGVAALEDVLEELVGEVVDEAAEHDG
ncbi:hemolysin family protein [Ornithinicoccus halotolerans]|uniref:hemolysin family protein n=1 Tax=Ornithinicoccus halotolerans TaxID=1748220 RepID=UPI001294D5D1|nr:hemolysin family protein [Ornithinicoccus halotolerans]